MAADQRVVVSENAVHFVSCFSEMIARAEICYGLMLTSNESMPRHAGTMTMLVCVLERELTLRPRDNALIDQMLWLRP